MTQKTLLTERLEIAGELVCLDSACKQIIANKIVLAWIMKSVLKEYRDYDVQTIAEQFIEGMPIVAGRTVHRDVSDEYIRGEDTADKTVTEGTVTFDIKFRAIAPRDNGYVDLILNIEAQKDFYPGYPIVKRGIYYCCRMISEQYGTEFQDSHYEDIKKVYSIWICMQPPKHRQHSISEYEIKEHMVEGAFGEPIENYDLLTAVMICLGKPVENAGESQTVIDMLSVLLSSEMGVEEKKRRLEKDFGIKMTKQLEEEAKGMCNYSEWVLEQGIEKGVLKTLYALVNDGILTFDEAARRANLTEQEFKSKVLEKV